jgi:uncharacterized protein (DUF362 family)
VLANSLVAGFFALCWLLLRSGTKPSRFTYPCQQAALSTATLAFGAPLVSTLLAGRRRLLCAVRTPLGALMAAFGLLMTVGVCGYLSRADNYKGPILSPRVDYRADVFHVPACPQDPVGDRFYGLDALLANMGRGGLKFFESATETLTAGPDGIIAPTDVVVVKINYQWDERGGTNTDVLRGLIRRIVDHPDGFTGEVVVCENAQFANTQGFDRTYNNAQNTNQSPHDVVADFQSEGLRVSHYDWTEIQYDSVNEYDQGDTSDGYVVYPYDSVLHGRISYPKFRTDYGTYISLKYGVFNPLHGGSYDRNRLKFINVPVLKSHSASYGATVCVKHYMGVVTGSLSTNSHSAIAYGIMGALMGEIQLADLNIIDAIWINANPHNGPWTGYDEATRRDELVASVDPVAADIWAVKNILIPAFLDNGHSPPWPQPDADPDDPNSDFRNYLDNSMYQMLSAGYDVTNDPGQIDVFTWRSADFDEDADVDIDDYDAFVSCFTGSGGGPVTPQCGVGDLDFDDDIDCDDWTLFTAAWTEPGDPPDLETCACVASEPPLAEPAPATTKIRFLSFVPGSAGQQTALRVTLTDLPEPFAGCNGTQQWLGPPYNVTEASSSADPTPEPTFVAARLQDEPHYADWGGLGTVHAFGPGVVPGGSYDIQAISQGCDAGAEPGYSAALPVDASGLWGDLVGDCELAPCTEPDGRTDFIDIMAVVDKFKNEPGAPIKARADLAGDLPDLVVDFVDISYAVEAFRGEPYPFDGPTGCD